MSSSASPSRPLLPSRAWQIIREQEADGLGGQSDVLTIFLTVARCPIGCVMCDLHRNTLDQPTPVGAVPQQIEAAIRQHPASASPRPRWLKLYNSGNFFDPQSIPPQDYEAIARWCEPFERVIVENHPRIGPERLLRFQQLLRSPLEIAVGLETVHPRWLKRLGKQMTRGDFDRYAAWLRSQKLSLRVFLIVGMPGQSVAEAIRWTRLSVRHAVACGARHVSLIPSRYGEGWDGRGNELPKLMTPHYVELLEQSLTDANGAAVITLDLWDMTETDPSADRKSSLDRIKQLSKTQTI